jgi:hypothetical protein
MQEGNPFKTHSAGAEAAPSEFPFAVTCANCGRRVGVSAGRAGAEIVCPCGNTLHVPLLSDLRRQEGKSGYGDDPRSVIARLLTERDSLPGDACVGCQRPTKEKIVCIADLESSQASSYNPLRYLRSIMLFFNWTLMKRANKDRAIRNNENAIRLPVTFCRQCREVNKDLHRGWALKKLLQCVPVYTQLLEECPQAKLTLAKEE